MSAKRLRGLRALGFTRRSTDEQGDSSNEQQEAILRGYADRHEMKWVGTVHAKGVSASNTEHRDDLDELIRRAAQSHDYDVLLIQSYDRLTRGGARHGGFLLHRFDQLGVRVISVSHDIPDGDWAPVIEAVEFSKGRAYAKSLAYNTTRGALASIFEGRAAYCRKVPFGVDRLVLDSNGNKLFRIRNQPTGEQLKLKWECDEVLETYPRNEKGGPFMHFRKRKEERIVLVPGDPKAVNVVKAILKMRFIDKIGVKTITMWLNDNGIPTPQGHARWNMCTVYTMLNNPVYSGRGVCNRYAEGEFNNRASQRDAAPQPAQRGRRLAERLRTPEEWLVIPLPGLEFIPDDIREEVWEKQRAALIRRAEYGIKVRELEQAKRDGTVDPDAVAVREVERQYCRPNTHWPLVGSIYERRTGLPMAGHRCGPTRSHRYYFVQRDRTNPTSDLKGKRKFFPAEAVEKAVLDVLKDVVTNLDEYHHQIEAYVTEGVRAASKDISEIERMTAEREKLRRKKAFALDKFEDLGEDLLAAKIGPLTAQIKEYDERIAAAERQRGASPEEGKKIVAGVMKALSDVPVALGEPASATLRSLISTLTLTSVDLDTREAEIEVRLPEAAFSRSNALKGMCATFGSARRTKHSTHLPDALILAKFTCKRTTVKRHPCLKCQRTAA